MMPPLHFEIIKNEIHFILKYRTCSQTIHIYLIWLYFKDLALWHAKCTFGHSLQWQRGDYEGNLSFVPPLPPKFGRQICFKKER